MIIMEVIAGHLWVKVVAAAALRAVIAVAEVLLLCFFSLDKISHDYHFSSFKREIQLHRRMSAALWVNSNYSLSKTTFQMKLQGAPHALFMTSYRQYHAI